MKRLDTTWYEVLTKKGFNRSISHSLIGFIAWEEDNMFPKMGKEINDVLYGYEGKIIAKDVFNDKYNNKGILFTSNDVSEETADEIFDTILKYEHEEVYDFQ